MKFWTRMLITIAIMNVFLMMAMPMLFVGESVPDELGNWYQFDNDPDALAQPGSGPGNQSYEQLIKTDGLSAADTAIAFLTLPNMLIDLVISLGAFINAPVAFMGALHFPGAMIVIFGAAYYTALVIGLATLIPGRDA